MAYWMWPLLALILGYLLGSIPFGLILTRATGAGDLRAIGSGSIGATNVLRTGRKGLAAATLLFDALKGVAAVVIAGRIGAGFEPFGAVGAIFGHCYPVWLHFRGGKGIATALGILLALNWVVAIAAGGVWLAMALIFRISSLASLAAVVAAPIFVLIFGPPSLLALVIALSLLIVWKHRDNIGRLIAGKEPAHRRGKARVNDAQDRLDRLRLIRSSNIGPVTYFQLIERFGTARAALDAIPNLAARGGGKAPQLAGLREIEAEIAAVEKLGARYLFLGQGLYPALLAEIDTAPPALIIRGDLRLLERPSIAIVGARNASAAAIRFARGLAVELANEDVVIVSGLARGIDTAAHNGSLEGGTIGVIASGIDIAYPPENAALQEEIATRGLLIAEQPPGREPLARHFPYRNRIIAGMSLGTVIVEAAPKSGSLITARLAGEAGREVMAIPGSPLDPRAQGCNQLIRDGATLVQSAADVIETIRPIAAGRVFSANSSFRAAHVASDVEDDERSRLVSLLSPTPVSVDELVRQSGMTPSVVQTILLECELAGRLERHAGGRVSLV